MPKICIVGPSPISRNPRLVRNADCLAAAGYDVDVIYPDFQPATSSADLRIAEKANWNAVKIDFSRTSKGRFHYNWLRIRRLFFAQFPRFSNNLFLSRSYGYFTPELTKKVGESVANLFLAQQQMAIIPAVKAANKFGTNWAVDVEDLLRDCESEPISQITQIEDRYLPQAGFISTMSEVAAERIKSQHNLKRDPIALHNCMTLSERGNLSAPTSSAPNSRLSLYWFGQTIGPHSCAEYILEAIARMQHPATLTLRGSPRHGEYIQHLRELSKKLGIENALHIKEPGSPLDMVRMASEHDICLGTQPSMQLFHQLAVGNKVFTGMMAGCAVGLSDTIAHRHLLNSHPGWAFIIPENSPDQLAETLNKFQRNQDELSRFRLNSWQIAESTFNWEKESRRLVKTVEQTIN